MKKAFKTLKVIGPALLIAYIGYLLLKPAISQTEGQIAAYSPFLPKK